MTELPFTLVGTVVRGKGLGSDLGFPTANIAYDSASRRWPREGVYAGVAQLNGEDRRYLVILNQGKHPTAPSGVPSVEAHLLGFPYQKLYGRQLTLSYQAFLRPESTFPTLNALQAQLSRDRQAALLWAEENEPQLAGQTDKKQTP